MEGNTSATVLHEAFRFWFCETRGSYLDCEMDGMATLSQDLTWRWQTVLCTGGKRTAVSHPCIPRIIMLHISWRVLMYEREYIDRWSVEAYTHISDIYEAGMHSQIPIECIGPAVIFIILHIWKNERTEDEQKKRKKTNAARIYLCTAFISLSLSLSPAWCE